MRALVVEDDPAGRRALVRLLRSVDLEVDTASTLEGARAWVTHQTPDLVVLDLLLADGSGIDLLEQIRSENRPVTVAVLSGADNELLADALVRRPDGLFDKPLDVVRFSAWLECVKQRRESPEADQ